MYHGICELVLESSDLGALERFYCRLGLGVISDPEGNRVKLWDFFRDGDGDDAGVDALAQDPDAR